MSQKSIFDPPKIDAYTYVKKFYNPSLKKKLGDISEKIGTIDLTSEEEANRMAFNMIDGIYQINQIYASLDHLYDKLVQPLEKSQQKAIQEKISSIKDQLLEEYLEPKRMKVFDVLSQLYGKMEVASMSEVTYDNFEKILADHQYAIFYFSSIGCPPCKNLKPKIITLSKEYQGLVAIGEVRADKDFKMLSHYKVQSVPTLIFFQDGKLVNRTIGDMPFEKLKECVEDIIKK